MNKFTSLVSTLLILGATAAVADEASDQLYKSLNQQKQSSQGELKQNKNQNKNQYKHQKKNKGDDAYKAQTKTSNKSKYKSGLDMSSTSSTPAGSSTGKSYKSNRNSTSRGGGRR